MDQLGVRHTGFTLWMSGLVCMLHILSWYLDGHAVNLLLSLAYPIHTQSNPVSIMRYVIILPSMEFIDVFIKASGNGD